LLRGGMEGPTAKEMIEEFKGTFDNA